MELVFLFIEINKVYCQNLKDKIAQLQLPPNFRIQVECASFEGIFDSILSEIKEQDKRLAPSFVFIDPFGPVGFPTHLMSRLAQQPRAEVLITFNYQSLNRWFLPDPAKHKRLDELYGDNRWRKALFIPDPFQKENYLREACQNALQENGWKIRTFHMINKHNQTQYYLFFGTRNWRGMLAMKRAMWKASPEGDFEYSDLTDPHPKLFQLTKDEDYSRELANSLYQKYRGNKISKQRLLEEDVAWHPACIERHLNRALAILEYETSSPKVTKVGLLNGRKRRAHTYPDDCFITFAP